MRSTTNPPRAQDAIVRIGAGAAVCVGAIVLAGWALQAPVLEGLLPGWATMKVNTAVELATAGISLWLLHSAPPWSAAHKLGRALAWGGAAIAALSLAEDVLSIDLGIDQLILTDKESVLHRGRMSPATAFGALMIGLALLTLRSRRPRVAMLTQWLAAPPIWITVLALAGYACGTTSLYAVAPYATMAIHTAGAQLILAVSLVTADSEHGIARIAFSDTAGGVVARRLFLTLPPALFLLGWASLSGEAAGWYDSRFSVAVMIVCSMTVCGSAVWGTASELRGVDLARRKALAEVMALNAGLESRVDERTRELAQVSETLRTANRTLEHLSLHDPLTGLPNRRYFESYFAAQMACARAESSTLALVMCDIDCFKAYNDRYGHLAGDDCLRRVADALRSCCRRPDDMAARYGGEEFALLLPRTDMAEAARIADAARRAVARLDISHVASTTASHVSICCGVASLSRFHRTAEDLIADADENLFRAKGAGRNCVIAARA